jgi:flagellar biosynthesis/type III secretory pathway protein FliH
MREYKKGFDEGYDAGHYKGYQEGFEEGSNDGYTRGYRDRGYDDPEKGFNAELEFVSRFATWLANRNYFDQARVKEIIGAWCNGEMYER